MARAKRLEWESFLNDGFTAETAAGDYCVTHDDSEWVLHFPDIGIVVERFAASDAAMAAGQAHFDALVASLIEEEPLPEVDWPDAVKIERAAPSKASRVIASPVITEFLEYGGPPARKI